MPNVASAIIGGLAALPGRTAGSDGTKAAGSRGTERWNMIVRPGRAPQPRAAGRWPKKLAAGARNLRRDLFGFVSATWGWTTPPFALGQG